MEALAESLLESEWRAAIAAIVVPMLQGAAVHTAVVAEQIAAEGSGQSQTN